MDVDYDDETFRRIWDWAHAYNAYDRLALYPGALMELIQPAREAFWATGAVPQWCGVDFLRGWVFYLLRQDRFQGGGTLEDEWFAVLDALRAHPKATPGDLPPA